jgi:phytoene dehydrogenase-like protein
MLLREGIDVRVLEASDGVGGRVRSDVVEGFVLDRGFQVLFTAYPAARRQLNMQALHLRRFDPGAIIARGTQRYLLTDPLRDPEGALPAALAPIVTPLDKLRTALLALELRLESVGAVLAGRDGTTESFLRSRGFSRAYIDYFIRPFYGGIFLDRSMRTSAKCFKFDFKMLAEGATAIPARGMGEISAQLARPLLATDRIRLNARVEALLTEDNRVTGVRLHDGTEMHAGVVVLSVPAPEAERLSGLPMPRGQVGATNIYWAGAAPVYRGKKIVLNANPEPFVNHAVQVTNVAPEYAPRGRHLLSATVLGVPEEDDEALFTRAMSDLRRMFKGDEGARSALATYAPLKVYRIHYGQFAQPPGIHPHLPANTSDRRGLLFASEFTEASSLNAAMISGEKAAEIIVVGWAK